MPNKKFDVTCIGNAIVDLFAHIEDGFLDRFGLNKGEMRLVDEVQAEKIYRAAKIFNAVAGGSAANTAAALASLGSSVAFIGRVRGDELGNKYEASLKDAGVKSRLKKSDSDPSTGHCVVLLTPDAERTFNTYLGAASLLGPEDIDEAAISDSKVVYMEGYLWDREPAKEAFLRAIEVAHRSGGKTALSLSDSFCVDRHRAGFLDLVKNRIDLVFSNESELKSLFETDSFEKAFNEIKKFGVVAAITRGAKGSVVVSKDETHTIPAEPVSKVVDTTGAGDLFAAGFLYGFTNGCDLAKCGKIGGIASAEIISHFGARVEAALAGLIHRCLTPLQA